MRKFFTFIMLIAAALALTACGSVSVPNGNSNVYYGQQMNQAQQVEYGTIVSTRQVAVRGDDSTGTVAGGVVGGILGNQIGHGSGRALGTIAGVMIGSTVGKQMAQNSNQQMAQEIVVRRQYDTISVIQGFDQTFYPGDRVMIHHSNGQVRVSRY